MSDKYNERVQALAKKIALAEYKWADWDMDDWKDDKDRWIAKSIPAARIAVAHMAEAVRKALSEWGCEDKVITTYLKKQGLIPDSPQEATWQPIDRPWNEYPIGTQAKSLHSGHWIKTDNGWKWFCGSTFPTPGADAISVCLPHSEGGQNG